MLATRITCLSFFLLLGASTACTTLEMSPSDQNNSDQGGELSAACKLLAPCCDNWPEDLRTSCAGPASVKGPEGESACKTFLANGTATAFCPELDILNCSDEMRDVMGNECVGGDGGTSVTVGLESFAPSNVGALTPPDGLGDVVLDGNFVVCDVDTSTGSSTCLSGANKLASKHVGDYDVLFAKSITIGAEALVNLHGTRPVVLVATETMSIKGFLSVGYSEKSLGDTAPRPGAKSTGSGVGTHYNGGGGYCGKGGGSFDGDGGGATYGAATLVPLTGGSNGSDENSGFAGGALHLVAGTKITIDGMVSANGQDGYNGGGGSGGAILIETPVIDGKGEITANGGEGGKNVNTNDGGGHGGQGASRDGTKATVAYASGGGGAGRIRINARNQAFGGLVTPSEASTCASKGTLASP